MSNVIGHLPQDATNTIQQVELKRRHPGLQLDKFSPPGLQEDQSGALDDVVKTQGDPVLFEALVQTREFMLASLRALCWLGTTTGSLTLHLARAAALENAGLCLHPLYGFVYFPGSGLKGMARAFAATSGASEADITRIFGHAPEKARGDASGAAGTVIFHEAWPTRWPALMRDIANVHHPDYYHGNASPPADWNNPNLVSFLAIGKGVEFRFALSPRDAAAAESDLTLARKWLIGALFHLGVGAKTNAGYGVIVCPEHPAPDYFPEHNELLTLDLRLVTPAFLAGAAQKAEDCTLRVPTLRGVLRWWWRTLHAGSVDLETLREMEAVVWGDTLSGSPVRMTVTPQGRIVPQHFDRVAHMHSHRLPPPPDNRTSMGLHYAAYGMDETSIAKSTGEKQTKRRWYVPAGSRWTLHCRIRPQPPLRDPEHKNKVIRQGLAAEQIREQVEAALWLLTHYGGVGSRGRKGFGSFADPPELAALDINQCLARAKAFREAWGVREGRVPDTAALRGAQPSLVNEDPPRRDWPELLTPLKTTVESDVWFALDTLGAALKAFAANYANQQDPKAALGLPRKTALSISRQNNGLKRWAAPAVFHFAESPQETLQLRIVAFAVPLPDAQTNKEIMAALMQHFKTDLKRQLNRSRPSGSSPRGPQRPGGPPRPPGPRPANRPRY